MSLIQYEGRWFWTIHTCRAWTHPQEVRDKVPYIKQGWLLSQDGDTILKSKELDTELLEKIRCVKPDWDGEVFWEQGGVGYLIYAGCQLKRLERYADCRDYKLPTDAGGIYYDSKSARTL